MASSELTDLVERAVEGDATAWGEIVSRLENLVWSVVRGFRMNDQDAQDATQLTWLRAVENLNRVSDPERLGLWLATIARRECMRIIERSSRSMPVDPQVEFVRQPTSVDFSKDVEDKSTVDSVIEALKTVSPDCQALLRLVLCDPPMSYTDIAELLDISVGTIGPRRQRCLSRLRAAAGL